MSGETIPAEPPRLGRWQSGGLNAAGFFVLLYIVSSVFFLTPLAVFFHAAMFFSLPVTAIVWLEDFLAHPTGYQLYAHTLHREGRLP